MAVSPRKTFGISEPIHNTRGGLAHHSLRAWMRLNTEKEELVQSSLAASTKRTYNTGVRQYRSFCAQFAFPPLPLREAIIENFATLLASRVGFKTIKVYLHGVQFFSHSRGLPERISSMVKLGYVLRGLRRREGSSHSRRTRKAISILQLHAIIRFIEFQWSGADKRMLQSAVSLAFFGLLRVSEYTASFATVLCGGSFPLH